ncbi:MAG: GIY-YIG nuclease family protein [Thermoflavifilum sp.]|uniref:GIY-YIG nuclease family protein n=1 Tax=Thermoflavifilum sp. TaxID=1968839 RepID=UPI0018A4855D|nr:GIY-YIG nuclease family protein [Thermoflavifilum sp.]QOR76685.1 MAG: GIY-YIG nuclease family protein [Thermoflavifilum sp.]
MERGGFVYIMTNKHRTVLYTGVTSNLWARVYQHRTHEWKGSFTDRYNLEYLVYYEYYSRIEEAIAREKQIKGWSRKKKEALIAQYNPDWIDLFDKLPDSSNNTSAAAD